MTLNIDSSIILKTVCWLLIARYGALAKCPEAEAIAPCSCSEQIVNFNDSIVETSIDCYDIPDAPTLYKCARGAHKSVHRFRVINSRVEFLPSNMFLNTNLTSVQVFHSPISHFTEDNKTAFLGLEKCLKEIYLVGCQITDSIKIETLSNLKELLTLDLSFNRITNVSTDWFLFPPEKLKILNFKGNFIQELKDEVFAYIRNLGTLDLSENRLTSLSRSVLPTMANYLEFLYLSYNDLEYLENDFFSNMPIIKKVYLDNNNLKRISQIPFEVLWNQNYLSHVDYLGNDILCDASLCWYTFLGEKRRNLVTGSCADPDNLRGRRLKTLWPWDLKCNESLYHGDMKLSYRARV